MVPLYQPAPPPARRPAGYWNLDKSGHLKRSIRRAIDAANERAPHLARVAELIVPLMPGRPRISRNIKTAAPSSWTETLCKALTAGWISYDTEAVTNALVVDVDHDDTDLLADLISRGLPAPVVVTVNPRSGHYHAVWWLATPVAIGPTAAPKPQRLYRLARALVCAALRADPDYRPGVISKCPWGIYEDDDERPVPTTLTEQAMAEIGSPLRHVGQDWGGEPVELRAIVAALHDEYHDGLPPRQVQRQITAEVEAEIAKGRNCSIFHRLRLWAYPRNERDLAVLTAQAHELNGPLGLKGPLPPEEVDGIARSVHKFMTHRYQGGGGADVDRGVMGLAGSGLPLVQRQRLGGQYGPKQRLGKTDTKLVEAAHRLLADGQRVTQSALAAAAAVGIATVKRHWQSLQAALADQPITPQQARPTLAAVTITTPLSWQPGQAQRPAPPAFFARLRRAGFGAAA